MTSEDKLFAANAILAFLRMGFCPFGFERDDLRAFSERLLKERASSAPAAGEGWQPIETAPKDGTPIMAYQPGGTYGNGIAFPASVGMAHWCEADALNPAHWEGPYNPRDYPTHWMPLPDPPLSATPRRDADTTKEKKDHTRGGTMEMRAKPGTTAADGKGESECL